MNEFEIFVDPKSPNEPWRIHDLNKGEIYFATSVKVNTWSFSKNGEKKNNIPRFLWCCQGKIKWDGKQATIYEDYD